MDEALGHWMAGFIAGEGHFGIHPKRGPGRVAIPYYCRFSLKLRDDDGDVLRELHTATGLGALTPTSARGSSRPGLLWVIASRADCAGLVELLDRFPLRNRKAEDYAIWREAVMAWNATMPWGKSIDWTPLAEAKARLEACRQYPEANAA